MAPRHQVSPLLNLCFGGCRTLVKEETLRVAHYTVEYFIVDEIEAEENFEDEFLQGESELRSAWRRERYLKEAVRSFKEYFLEQVPYQLLQGNDGVYDAILGGINDAIHAKKMVWTPATNMTRFTREMHAIVEMSTLLAIPQRTHIDFDLFPKMIRSKMYGWLGEFTGCQTAILGSGSGGWVTEAYADKFLLGIPHLKNLVHFSLKYDCTLNVLQVLSETCPKTLKILDIEHSRQVRKNSIPYILDLPNLEKINIFQCDFSTEDQLQILIGLPKLIHLHRGDFVGDVADELAVSKKYANFRSQIKDFWASEEYYFHSEEQMMNVVQFFPKIEKMLYMFQPLHSAPMPVLGLFQYLENIDLWGGRFYNDDILELLSEVGNRLVKLSLVHAEELDSRAIALITSLCPKVRSLGFHNCEFIEEGEESPIESFQSADRFLCYANRADLRKELLAPLLELKTIKIISACRSDMISWILESCLNVEQINLGLNTDLDDSCIFNTLSRNRLQKLQKLNVQKCKKVTMKGVTTLLENCPNLYYIKDLFYFDAISKEQLFSFQEYIEVNNLNLEITNKVNENQYKEANFMKFSMKEKFPALDNSPEWAT